MGLIIVGATLQTSSFTLAHLIVGRIITGFGTGIDSSTVPMYQSELSKKEYRGRLVSWEIWFIGVGIVSAYWIDFGFSYVDSPVAWRTPIGIQLIFAIVVTIVVFVCPESPRWLAKKGRHEEAVDVLCRVHGLEPTDPYIVSEMEMIEANIAMEKSETSGKFFSLFKTDHLKTRRRVILAYFVLFMNQMGGISECSKVFNLCLQITDWLLPNRSRCVLLVLSVSILALDNQLIFNRHAQRPGHQR